MKRFTLSLALASAFALPAVAADYYVVVPIKGRVAAPETPPDPAAAISVSLQSASLPDGLVGQAYSYDLKQHLLVTGDSSLDLAQSSWSASTALPAGLSLSANGVIEGAPTTANAGANFDVVASYKTKSSQQTYALTVKGVNSIAQFTGYRAWSDGSFAQSCHAYRYPSGANIYSGSVGDGVYKIQPPGQDATNVYCDMASGGYTLLGRAVYGNSVSSWVGAVNGLNIPSNPTPSTGTTFKYSDAFISALPKSVYKVGSTGYPATRYWSGSCVYTQQSSSDPACFTSYTDEALSAGVRVGVVANPPLVGGLHDMTSNGGVYIGTSYVGYPSLGWVAGDGTGSVNRGTGSAGVSVSLYIWAK